MDNMSRLTAHPLLPLLSPPRSTIMPILAALGKDVLDSWCAAFQTKPCCGRAAAVHSLASRRLALRRPPFLSNVVFELWELPPQAAPSGASPAPTQRHAVRVLYNREELDGLPHCPSGEHAHTRTRAWAGDGQRQQTSLVSAAACACVRLPSTARWPPPASCRTD